MRGGVLEGEGAMGDKGRWKGHISLNTLAGAQELERKELKLALSTSLVLALLFGTIIPLAFI